MGGRRRLRVAVVGGGIGGLSAAHALVESADIEVTVYEGSQTIGGKLQLGQVGGVPVDLGAESILARRPEALELARAVGLRDAIVEPAVSGAGVWTRGAVRPLPPTLLGVPGNPRAARKSGILSRRGAWRASIEPRLRDLDLSDDVAVGQLVARRLGHEVRDRLVDPLLGGVYAASANDLSLRAAAPQLAAALEHNPSLLAAARSVLANTAEAVDTTDGGFGRTGDGAVFAGIDGGVGRLAREVARAIQAKGASVRFGSMVRQVVQSRSGWQVVSGPTARARTDNFDAVVVAAPARSAGRMLRDAAPAAAAELGAHRVRVDGDCHPRVRRRLRSTPRLSGTGLPGPARRSAHYQGRDVLVAQVGAGRRARSLLMRCSVGRYGDEQ